MNTFINMVTEPVKTNQILPVMELLIFAGIILCLWNLNGWLRAKKKKAKLEYKKLKEQIEHPQVPVEPYSVRMDSSKKLMDMIQHVASEEIAGMLFTFSALQQEYPIARMDEDIKAMSETVYKGLDPSCISNPNNIFTPQYILTYINRYVANTFIDVVRQFNAGIRNAAMRPPEEPVES